MNHSNSNLNTKKVSEKAQITTQIIMVRDFVNYNRNTFGQAEKKTRHGQTL